MGKNKSLHIFNPNNDLALADFNQNYTPPKSIIKLQEDLEILPIWYTSGITAINKNKDISDFFLNIKEKYQIKSQLLDINDVYKNKISDIKPWGWSPYIIKELTKYGFDNTYFPNKDQLNNIREYSNRKNAIKILYEIKKTNPIYCGESHYFTDSKELLVFLNKNRENKVLKKPISGSGKGIIWILNGITEKQQQWAEKVIKDQGGIIAEPLFEKQLDFALEFFSKKGKIKFIGYSLFKTLESGAYSYNKLLTNRKIKKILSKYFPINLITALISQLENKLSKYFSNYEGYLGVDMMICKIDNKNYIHPCVEINMRMNMGIVSNIIFKRHIHKNSIGIFKMYYSKDGVYEFNEEMKREHPPILKNKKIVSGYQELNQISKSTKHIAYILVENK